MQLIGTDYK